MRSSKFTLIELLVVVAIIGILASMLLPSLSKAREVTKRAVCASNMKQQLLAFTQYAGDNDGKFPRKISNGTWPMGNLNENRGQAILYTQKYLEDGGNVLYCPSYNGNWITQKSNFRPNNQTSFYTHYPYWANYGRVVNIDKIATDIYTKGMMLTDRMIIDTGNNPTRSNHAYTGFIDGGNIGFTDSHVKWKSYKSMTSKFTLANKEFFY